MIFQGKQIIVQFDNSVIDAQRVSYRGSVFTLEVDNLQRLIYIYKRGKQVAMYSFDEVYKVTEDQFGNEVLT